MTGPTDEWMARAMASGMLWPTGTNSRVKPPRPRRWPALMGRGSIRRMAVRSSARVDQYEVVAVLQERAILADLADSPQRDHLEQARAARGTRGSRGLRGTTPAGRPPRASPGRLASVAPSSVLAHRPPSSLSLRR